MMHFGSGPAGHHQEPQMEGVHHAAYPVDYRARSRVWAAHPQRTAHTTSVTPYYWKSGFFQPSGAVSSFGGLMREA